MTAAPRTAEAPTWAPSPARRDTTNLFNRGFGLIIVFGLVFAFVGLASSSYYVDELFTLYLIDHHSGFSEVLTRALTDTSPPAYDLLLYGWSMIAGTSEVALRAPSALFAVGAVMVFVLGLRRRYSLPARLFAAAVAVSGHFWFVQSQMARNYALSLLVSSSLIVLAVILRERIRTGRPVALAWASLSLVALAGTMVHFFLALEAGLVIAFLILTTGGVRLKIALIASGLACVAVTLAYSATLLGHTKQDIHHMWFGTDPKFLAIETARALHGVAGFGVMTAIAILGALAVAAGGRSPPESSAPEERERIWVIGLALFIAAGLVALGLTVSALLAPVYSERNLLVAAPVLWLISAALFEHARPALVGKWGILAAAAIIAALGAVQVVHAVGRFLPTQQEWRSSARYVDNTNACRGKLVPVLALQTFAPHTPYFLELERSAFYGHYARQPGRLAIYMPSDFGARDRDHRGGLPEYGPPAPPIAAELARARPDLRSLVAERLAGPPNGCHILAWASHVVEPSDIQNLRQAMAASVGASESRIVVRSFQHFTPGFPGWRSTAEAFVVEAAPVPPGP